MVADAVVPPSPPSNVFRNRGTRCTPGGGCAPCTLLGEWRWRILRLLTWRIGRRGQTVVMEESLRKGCKGTVVKR